MKATDITKPTALFLTKIVLAAVLVCTAAQCNNTDPTAKLQKESIAEEETFARENKVLKWYFDKIGFKLNDGIRYMVLISDRTCVGCGSWVLNEMLNKNLDSTMLIVTNKLSNKYSFLANHPRVFVDKQDVINTLNWDYPGITDIELSDGKIVAIQEHEIVTEGIEQ